MKKARGFPLGFWTITSLAVGIPCRLAFSFFDGVLTTNILNIAFRLVPSLQHTPTPTEAKNNRAKEGYDRFVKEVKIAQI